jgi:large subunit ribosomal protein L21
MFAVIETGGKQYRIAPGDKLRVPRLRLKEGESFVFDKVLLLDTGKEVKVGKPYLTAVKVAAKLLRQGREDKKIVFRYRAKTRYRRKKGHRQPFSEVEITSIK